MKPGRRDNERPKSEGPGPVMAVSTLEPLYKVYERLIELERAYRRLRFKDPYESQRHEAFLQRLRADREAVYEMVTTARVNLGILQSIYRVVVSLNSRWSGDPIDRAISSLRTALCRYR